MLLDKINLLEYCLDQDNCYGRKGNHLYFYNTTPKQINSQNLHAKVDKSMLHKL
jgi:hypothetical protein